MNPCDYVCTYVSMAVALHHVARNLQAKTIQLVMDSELGECKYIICFNKLYRPDPPLSC